MPLSQDNPDLKLLFSLKKYSANLALSSEGDYPYELFLWDVRSQGDFTIDKFLNVIGHQKNSVKFVEEVANKQDLKLEFDRDNEPYFEINDIEYEIIQTSRLDFQDDYLVECELYSRYELFDRFFGYIYSDSGYWDEEIFLQYKHFSALVTDNLSNIKVFRLVKTKVDLYLVGQTQQGNWIGIHTISIET